MSNDKLWDQAEELANRSYEIVMEQDTLSDGEVIFLLKHPELPGCKAQGSTIDEAKANLDEARVDYIYALLEMGLTVPPPLHQQSLLKRTENSQTYVFVASGETLSKTETAGDRSSQSQDTKLVGGYVAEGDLLKQR